MFVTAKQSVIYKGKLYRRGEQIEIDEADFNSDLSKLNLWLPLEMPPADVVAETSEPAQLPPLEASRKKK